MPRMMSRFCALALALGLAAASSAHAQRSGPETAFDEALRLQREDYVRWQAQQAEDYERRRLATIQANAQANDDERTVGAIKTFAFDYCPTGTLNATGGLASFDDFQVLYLVIGEAFGPLTDNSSGSYVSLPDLSGRAMVGDSETTVVGAKAGAAGVTLTMDHLPLGFGPKAVAGAPGQGEGGLALVAGSADPIRTVPPYLALRQCIVTQGEFPNPPQ